LKFLLDTNVLIDVLRARPAAEAIRQRMESLEPGEAAICSVVREELVFGALRAVQPEARAAAMHEFLVAFPSLPFDDAAADHAARIRHTLAARGTPIGPHDVQIAGIALARGLTLVTRNTGEYLRVEGLAIDDWTR
jgi:tRNA(fMet)-specific endonuclease VapC